MIHLLLLLSFKLIALSLSASFLSTELSCPEGGYITREKYCEKTPGCENGEDSDTIYPRGPCISEGQKNIPVRDDQHFTILQLFSIILQKLETILWVFISPAIATKERSFR